MGVVEEKRIPGRRLVSSKGRERLGTVQGFESCFRLLVEAAAANVFGTRREELARLGVP